MPVGAVKYESLWNRARALVARQYPDVKSGTDKYWRLVMAIYKRMEKARDRG